MYDLSHLLTVPDAAQALGVTQGAVRIAINEGRMPATVVVGRKVIAQADLEDYRRRTRPGGVKPKGRPPGSRAAVSSALVVRSDAEDV